MDLTNCKTVLQVTSNAKEAANWLLLFSFVIKKLPLKQEAVLNELL